MAGSHHRRRHPSYYAKRRRRRRHHPYHPRNQLSEQQQQQQEREETEQQNSSGCSMDESETDIYIPVPVPLLDIGITSWLPLLELGGAWRWCSDKVTQSLDWVKDAVFPSRVYQRELQETKDQLRLLHQQIEQLKEQTLKIKCSKPAPVYKCNCQNSMQVNLSKSHVLQPSGHNPKPTANRRVLPGESIPPPVPAVAPPPPPPPPPPPITLPTKAPVFKKKGAAKSSSQASTGDQRPLVTLSDIMNVKLKKVSDQQSKQPTSDASNQRAVVTLMDIMNIELRKTFKDKKTGASGQHEVGNGDLKAGKLRNRRSLHQNNDENVNGMVLRSRISEEALQYRGCLRKVSMVRSPGGTPLRNKPSESQGTGLTPLMTKALRRKFKTIRTPSPSTQLESISPSFNTSN
ncbi:proline-rich protein 11-like [Acanthaster planci]|uniref:Proline-rich protein 11-like n=1 Tax=Acanthaster planci TaxID=133434 RepID=A0A8B7XXI8_ACAPL|nr:proline-rich protein 11-like [Acanthaster planci]